MAKYIDGFVLVVPKNKVAVYKKMAREGKKIWKKYGALDYKECVGNDLHPKMKPGFKHLIFPKMARAKRNEAVWFSYIVYKSKKHRNEVNAKVMKEMEKSTDKYKNMQMPFDMPRFCYGGFEVVVE